MLREQEKSLPNTPVIKIGLVGEEVHENIPTKGDSRLSQSLSINVLIFS